MSTCPLCQGTAHPYFRDKRRSFSLCPRCSGIFTDPEFLPLPRAEHLRYLQHQNQPLDTGYRASVQPLIDVVLKRQSPTQTGLDYGAGPQSAVSVMLAESGFELKLYDPLFHPEPAMLQRPYDFVICCEVIEHFHNPRFEFGRLREMLARGGRLYIKTALFDAQARPFGDWYYKNDFTH
ncbi:MAG: methyltransferase domain-containing protein, partial [Flavobacteriales bacterium]|nr:methyltransferase domain-containing protein [Flavobacteriales bacterium]